MQYCDVQIKSRICCSRSVGILRFGLVLGYVLSCQEESGCMRACWLMEILCLPCELTGPNSICRMLRGLFRMASLMIDRRWKRSVRELKQTLISGIDSAEDGVP